MFSRVTYESFQLIFPLIGFFLIFGVFLAVLIKVFLMKKEGVQYLSQIPLNDDEEIRSKPDNHDQR